MPESLNYSPAEDPKVHLLARMLCVHASQERDFGAGYFSSLNYSSAQDNASFRVKNGRLAGGDAALGSRKNYGYRFSVVGCQILVYLFSVYLSGTGRLITDRLGTEN